MTTKLLRQIHEQDQEALAERHNLTHTKQPRRVWAVEAMKPCITEAEYEAAKRAVRECIMHFPGATASMDKVDMAWSDAGMANKCDAGHFLYGIERGLEARWKSKEYKLQSAKDCVSWLVQLHTLQDIAVAMRMWRRMGPGRDPIPDARRVTPFVRLVLLGMTSYYEACDLGRESWSGRAA